MTQEFFQKQMEILFSIFGRKEYPPARMALIWEDCQDLSPASFASMVRHFCKTKSVDWPPLPTHFMEAAHEYRKKERDEKPKLSVVQGGLEPLSFDDITRKPGALLEALEKRTRKPSST